MKNIILLPFLLCLAYFETVKALINLNALAYVYTEKQHFLRPLVDGFNEYAKSKSYNIHLDLTMYTPENSTVGLEDYAVNIVDMVAKNKTRFNYDIFFYYGAYSSYYSNTFLNITKYVKSSLKKFSPAIIKNSSIDDDTLIGFPLYIDVSTLYSNTELLKRYDREVPKTWDDLIDTARDILKREKAKNGESDLIGYNGLLNAENAALSLFEIIHSYREKNTSEHPSIKSKETVSALNKLKYLMKEISSADIFQSNDYFTIQRLTQTQQAIFLKFWYIGHLPTFKATALPGWKEGVSGSIALANSIGINKYLPQDKVKAAAEFVKYIALEETQKKLVMEYNVISAMEGLYVNSNSEVCTALPEFCEFIQGTLPFSSMDYSLNQFGNSKYRASYRDNLIDFVFKDKELSDALDNIDEIFKMYSYSLDTSDTVGGLIFFIIVVISLLTMLFFLVTFSIKYITKQSKYVLWVISAFGSMAIMFSIFTQYGELNITKCWFRLSLITCGFCTGLIPPLYITLERKFNDRFNIAKYKIYIVGGLIMVEIFLNLLIAMNSSMTVIKEKNFEKCGMHNTFGKVIYYMMAVWMVCIAGSVLIVICTETSIVGSLDFKASFLISFTNIASFIVYLIVNKIHIEYYLVYYLLYSITSYILSVNNYFLIYGKKIIYTLINGKDVEDTSKLNSISNNPTPIKSNDDV